MRIRTLLLVLALCLAGCRSSVDDGIVFIDLSGLSEQSLETTEEMTEYWDIMHVTATLQGIVNRDKPRMFIAFSGPEGETDRFWWDEYRKPGKWMDGRTYSEEKDIIDVVRKFLPLVKGLVVYDTNVNSTSNVASTVAGVEDLIAVRYDLSETSMYSKLKALGLKEKVWLVNKDGSSMFGTKLEPYEWAVRNYLAKGKCSGEYAAYYVDQFWNKNIVPGIPARHHQLSNHDFFVSRKAFFFDLSPWDDEEATDAPGEGRNDLEMLKKILLAIYDQNGGEKFCHIGGFPLWSHKYTRFGTVGGGHGEVETEWQFVKIASAFNAFVDADAIGLGDLANASFWQHFPLKEQHPQEWVTREDLKARGYLTPEGKVDTTKEYVLFYVGDYDSASWLSSMASGSIWDDPARGSLPLMWCISPVLADRVPHVMEYVRSTASDNDYFAAADCGAGYLNPGMLQSPREISGLPSGLDAWSAHCRKYYGQWGLTVSGFVIDGFAPGMDSSALACYRSFSPDGLVCQKLPESTAILFDGMPVLKEEAYPGGSPEEAVNQVLGAMASRDVPFHWFRTVLQTPSWHLQVKEKLEQASPDIVWMDAPSYFELLKCYLEQSQPAVLSRPGV